MIGKLLRGLRSDRRYQIALVLLILVLALPLAGQGYVTALMVTIGIYSIITVGLCLLMGYTGQVSLGHAAFFGIGAFVSGILSATYGFNPWISMAIAAIASALVAYLTAWPIFRLRGHYLAMATLGFGIIIYVIFREMSQFTGGPSGLPGIPNLSIGGLEFSTDLKNYYLVWAVCLACLLVSRNIVTSRSGRALRAVHGNERAARSVGIDVTAFKVKVFMLSAVYASIAGSLYAHYITYVSPEPFSFMSSIRLVVMVVLGGLGSVWGAVFGAAAYTVLSNELQRFGSIDIVVFGLIVIAVMIFLPQGLFRGVVELWQRRKEKALGGPN